MNSHRFASLFSSSAVHCTFPSFFSDWDNLETRFYPLVWLSAGTFTAISQMLLVARKEKSINFHVNKFCATSYKYLYDSRGGGWVSWMKVQFPELLWSQSQGDGLFELRGMDYLSSLNVIWTTLFCSLIEIDSSRSWEWPWCWLHFISLMISTHNTT